MTGPRTSDAIVYVDTSTVREGALTEVRATMAELVEFVESEEPQILAYHVYFDEDGSRMTVYAVHPDSSSLEHHMDVGGPRFQKLVGLITMESIDIYGRPSDRALTTLRGKARMLGHGRVSVHSPHAGFTRPV